MENLFLYHDIGKDPMYKIWHTSPLHLFMYFHSDGGNVVSAERVFPIQRGALVFIAANTYHYTMPDVPEEYDRSKMNVSPDMFQKILDLFSRNAQLRSFSDQSIIYAEIDPEDHENVDAIFREMASCQTEDEQQFALPLCCMRLLMYLKKYYTGGTSPATGLMGKAIDYINNNISMDITIDDVCRAVGISKYHFCRQFKAHTKLTVMDYILKTRIILAKSELSKTNLSIADISEKCGFSSASYFCRVFKAEVGCTPLQYRKQHKDLS